MKLVICVVHNRYSDALEKGLKKKGYRMTELASSGGFLKKGSTTFLFGVKDGDAAALKKDMKEICTEHEAKKGKAKDVDSRYTSFVIDAKDSLPLLTAFHGKNG
ncbi:cyclic-di-AMP receptor [Alteribacter natronophilus]|uniref:cyclic-di-AMP receptor n=1 Tax=Alteribacter natronophilus TaxID=2583810 RepID=UPI00110EB87C|nr:cyclic-di-AMP receptor [Alteribacter natronophilus]TMW70518.1 transcriptional regulator [Alteribacter natronophilus]